VDLWHGKCRESRLAVADESAEYTYSGSLENWKKLIGREIGPIRGIVSRRFGLDGSLFKLMRYIKAAQILVENATRVPTRWPDEE
jgi:putative sterol carrier protein